jgi:hypothetical protein
MNFPASLLKLDMRVNLSCEKKLSALKLLQILIYYTSLAMMEWLPKGIENQSESLLLRFFTAG